MLRFVLISLVSVGSVLLPSAAFARSGDCSGTGWSLQCPPQVALGGSGVLELIGPGGGDIALIMASLGEGPTQTNYGTICLDFPLLVNFLIPLANDGTASLPFNVPDIPGIACTTIHLQFLTCVQQRGLSNQCSVTLVDETCGDCLVIIDLDTIDNDISTIEAAAASHNELPGVLINDDHPTETSNPPLHWNELYAGDIVVLPGGKVDDEGIFALPPNTPFTIADYAAGIVPQADLDPVYDVMPLRNHDIYSMIGLTCVAVVYDSDISQNFVVIQGNLQGGRLGLFRFTVLDVLLPGTIPESQSSTSLYDLVVRVETPALPTIRYDVVIRDHEPDSIQTTRANYDSTTGVLEVWGTSNFAPTAIMTVSIDGFVLEAPMTYNSTDGRYEYSIVTGTDLDGRRVMISTDEGGSYNVTIN